MAGTLLSVRLAETLSTDKVKAGDAFTATLDRPLVVDGLVIAERGTRLEGRVVEAQEAGRVQGVSRLSIHLVRLNTRDGQRVNIQTSKGEDVAKVGAGAGLGAIIGAIAGGGKGAGIGAAVGGAAGVGTVAATRGKPAVLPVETRIDFRLSSSVSLTEQK
jgi:outer membrane lipoprotein SlyB